MKLKYIDHNIGYYLIIFIIFAAIVFGFVINKKGSKSYVECEALNNVLKRVISRGNQKMIDEVIKDAMKKNCDYLIN